MKKEEMETTLELAERYRNAIDDTQEIGLAENVMIQTISMQLSFNTIMNGLEKGDYIIPGFQRVYRWSEKQAQELAVSLVRGMPIPPIYCYRNEEQQLVILDGQQRVLSLYFYYIGKFIKAKKNAFINMKEATNGKMGFKEYLESCHLMDKTYVMEYIDEEGQERQIDITYKKLNERLQRKIDYVPITFVQINVDSDEYREKTLHKIFANLNTGGTPLSSQELRNGIYNCRFYEMLYQINEESAKWRELYSGNAGASVNKESMDVELLLEMCAFFYYVKGKKNDFVLTQYKGKKWELLDDFSSVAREFDEQTIEDYREKLVSFFDTVENVSGKNKGSLLTSLFVAWNRLEKKTFISKKKCEEIVKDKRYSETIISGTARKGNIEQRIRSVYEKISSDD